MNNTPIHGSCLCGAVTFEVTPPFPRMVHCHCSRCRKASGTGHATNIITMEPGQLKWLTGEELISRYELPAARSFGKWFCNRCGSPVPRVTRNGKAVVIPAGSLNEAPPGGPTDHIFFASRASWACESSGLPTHDEYPESWLAPKK